MMESHHMLNIWWTVIIRVSFGNTTVYSNQKWCESIIWWHYIIFFLRWLNVWIVSTFLLIWWISIIRLVTIIWWAPIIMKFHHKFGYARTWNDITASESPEMRAWEFVLHFCCKILNLYTFTFTHSLKSQLRWNNIPTYLLNDRLFLFICRSTYKSPRFWLWIWSIVD